MLTAEVGPQHIGEHELAVRQLPEEEVRDAELARRANHQVGIRHLGVIETSADGLLVDLLGRYAFGNQRTNSVDDLSASAVVERDRQRHHPIVTGELERLIHPLEDAARHAPVAPTGEANAHTLLVQLVATPYEERLVELHEVADLVRRTPPVLGREGIDREPLHAELEGAVHRIEQSFLAGSVTFGPG